MESETATLGSHMMNQAPWLVAWLMWLVFVNVVSVIFVIRHTEARWVLVAFVVNVPLMNLLYDSYGFVRVLGLSHIIVWTPLLVFLVLRRSRFNPRTLFGGWITVLMLTNGISLVVDYVDLARFLMGDGALPH
jgi:hypothetical protein